MPHKHVYQNISILTFKSKFKYDHEGQWGNTNLIISCEGLNNTKM